VEGVVTIPHTPFSTAQTDTALVWQFVGAFEAVIEDVGPGKHFTPSRAVTRLQQLKRDFDARLAAIRRWEPGGCPGEAGRCIHMTGHMGDCESAERRNAREGRAS
jgi:hypothetical protein